MATADFFIKEADTAPAIVAVLSDATDTVVDVTGTTVRFIMTNKLTAEIAVDAAAELVDPGSGVVKYQWQTGDTDVAGPYKAEFEVAWSDGTYETFPNATYINVKVVADLGGTVT